MHIHDAMVVNLPWDSNMKMRIAICMGNIVNFSFISEGNFQSLE